jgi:hypothetical protein
MDRLLSSERAKRHHGITAGVRQMAEARERARSRPEIASAIRGILPDGIGLTLSYALAFEAIAPRTARAPGAQNAA